MQRPQQQRLAHHLACATKQISGARYRNKKYSNESAARVRGQPR